MKAFRGEFQEFWSFSFQEACLRGRSPGRELECHVGGFQPTKTQDLPLLPASSLTLKEDAAYLVLSFPHFAVGDSGSRMDWLTHISPCSFLQAWGWGGGIYITSWKTEASLSVTVFHPLAKLVSHQWNWGTLDIHTWSLSSAHWQAGAWGLELPHSGSVSTRPQGTQACSCQTSSLCPSFPEWQWVARSRWSFLNYLQLRREGQKGASLCQVRTEFANPL